MKSIVKSLALASPETAAPKWTVYRTHFMEFFSGRDTHYDKVVDFISDFHDKFGVVPDYEAFARELTATNETALLAYLADACGDPAVEAVAGEAAFAAHLEGRKVAYASLDLRRAVRDLQAGVSGTGVDLSRLKEAGEGAIASLTRALRRVEDGRQGTSLYLFQGQARDSFHEHYQGLKRRREGEGAAHYPVPFRHFGGIRVKPGDLVLTGAFTSQGKSILLRYLVYRLAVDHGLNAAFWSLEMDAEVVRVLFAILHANNKQVFPGTPYVAYESYLDGDLTAEQEDFLFRHAYHDLTENPNYGSILIEQPPEGRFTLPQLVRRVAEIERTLMEIQVLGVDYITRMYPSISERAQPQASDFNQLIADYKSYILTHRSPAGKRAPLIGVSAAQISRGKYDDAVKNEGAYDITAFSMFTEAERSADIVFTSYMPPALAQAGIFRMQNHKYRDGAVVLDPVDLRIDPRHGYDLSEVQERTQADTVAALKDMDDL